MNATEEPIAVIDEEVETLKASQYLTLSEGWTNSRHYAEGYVAGQLATLFAIKQMLEHLEE